MSGVFQNIYPHPSHRPASTPLPFVRGENTLAGWKGGGGSIFWKTPDTALYSTYVSTLWIGTYCTLVHDYAQIDKLYMLYC
jgi:hypothetical protein